MGSPGNELGRTSNEEPVHEVKIDYDFYLSETEVTQAQWQAVMGSNPSYFKDSPDHPVDSVSWEMVGGSSGFLKKLNALGNGQFRLPSESEWEYACRAYSTTRFSFGNSLGCSDICSDCIAGIQEGMRSSFMWFCGDNGISSRPVGLLEPNIFGLYDMHGNLWEWCADPYHDTYYNAPHDGSVWQTSGNTHVIRGGSWGDMAYRCRSAARSGGNGQFSYLGFRLAADVGIVPTQRE